MAQGRSDLQSVTSISGNNDQDVRFAGRIPGGAKSGLGCLTITNPAGAGSLSILTSPDLNLDPTLWKSIGSFTSLTANGFQTLNLTAMCDYIRWSVSGMTGGPLRFSLVVYSFDA
ncbi:MAG: hypothetical protein HY996_00585 [Micrococcales bacterium]|nr:hypothetical protein [Micrococcales bacterium]